MMAVFADGRIWLMCWIYFTVALGQYALTLDTPFSRMPESKAY